MIKGKLNEKVEKIMSIMRQAIAEKTRKCIEERNDIKDACSVLFCKLRTKWAKARRIQTTFLRQNKGWLSTKIRFPVLVSNQCDTLPSTPAKTVKKKMRSPQPFQSLSERAKRRKIEEIRKTVSSEELAFATQMSLRSSG